MTVDEVNNLISSFGWDETLKMLENSELLNAMSKTSLLGETMYGRNAMTSCTAVPPEKIMNAPAGETDPNGRNPHEPGAKLDAGKTPVFQGCIDYFPRAVREVAAVSAFGASKYAWKGWETVPDGVNRYSNAMVRHLISEATGESLDGDSGLLHKAHCAWNAMAVLELALREREGMIPKNEN